MEHNIIEKLKKFSRDGYVSFHMPGHNYGKGMENEIFNLDVTELYDTDNLASPKGIIKEAQQKAADFYKADESFFLVNGSTIGILSAIYASFSKGSYILVDRMCHKSVINAIILADLVPVFAYNEYIEEFGIFSPVSPLQVEKILADNPQIVGGIITSPTYYGLLPRQHLFHIIICF